MYENQVVIAEDDVDAYKLRGSELKAWQRENEQWLAMYPHLRGSGREEDERREFVHNLLAKKQVARQAAEQKAVESKKALPPARPRRKPQRTVKTLKNGDLTINLRGYVTGDDLKAFGEFLKSELDDSHNAIQAALNKRLLWRGTWRSGESYAENDLVQDKGTIWVCTAAKTEGRPGTGSWRMLVKTQEKGPAK